MFEEIPVCETKIELHFVISRKNASSITLNRVPDTKGASKPVEKGRKIVRRDCGVGRGVRRL